MSHLTHAHHVFRRSVALRATLIQAALAATRTWHGAFAARYRRLLRHRGLKKAVGAVAHALLVTAYHVSAYQRPTGNSARTTAHPQAPRLPRHAGTRGLSGCWVIGAFSAERAEEGERPPGPERDRPGPGEVANGS